MGVYSTRKLTREQCLACIEGELALANDKQLSEVLFELLREKLLYNYMICENAEESDYPEILGHLLLQDE